jgi:ubiquinone/menaquinone biosynthesis C-methylase UbiE
MERGQTNNTDYMLTRADAQSMPIADNSVDIVTAMDVIEHIPDDKAALREISRILKPGGYLLATVPAFQSLWSDHDVALHHFRRYTQPSFRDVIQRSGLGPRFFLQFGYIVL